MRASTHGHACLRGDGRAEVVVFWHNQILLPGEFHRRYRPGRAMCGLVSASRDGAWLAALFRELGIDAVRGSSSKRALTATREVVAKLRAGSDVAITPDGPRGPRYHFQPGAALVALLGKCPVLVISFIPERAWRLKSWDRCYVPKPFSAVHVRGERLEPEHVRALAGEGEDRAERLAEALRQRLMQWVTPGETPERNPAAKRLGKGPDVPPPER